MEIKKVVVKPYGKSIYPGLSFEVEINHRKYEEAIIGVSGWLETDDEKIIAEINEAMIETSRSDDVGATGSRFNSKFEDKIYKVSVIALLDKRALDYIEKRRMKDKKGDVKLILNLSVKNIENRAVISQLQELNPAEMEKMGLKSIDVDICSKRTSEFGIMVGTSIPDSKFYPKHSNQWILSGSDNPVFLAVKEQRLRISLDGDKAIRSSDWIHDYAPKLELGEYFVIEIPKGTETIKKAWDYIEKAEECFRIWDTKGAFANCREAGSLLNDIIKDKYRNNPTIKKWHKAIAKFESLASLDLHTEEIKRQKPEGEVKVGKSDTEHILIVTKALIKYAEELLKEGG